jgi:hypothetical protein
MAIKEIRPDHPYTPCDICGRTLLRGERSEVFVHAGHRRTVCELCKPRAIQDGWKREGAMLDYSSAESAGERRAPLRGRFRRGRGDAPAAKPTLDDALSEDPFAEPAPVSERPARRGGSRGRRERPERQAPPAEDPGIVATPGPAQLHARLGAHGSDQRVISALEHFNRSEFPRTIAGVARSLGPPTVNLTPDRDQPTIVWITVSWELCWYRYEVDLDLDGASVRLDSQGYELSELSELQRLPGGEANDVGQLTAYR